MDKLSIAQKEFVAKQVKHKRYVRICQVLILIGFFSLWEIASAMGWINSFIFSSPSRMFTMFVSMAKEGTIAIHVLTTLGETLVSFLIVLVVGLIISLLLWLSKGASEIIEPYLVTLNSLPKSALAPVLIVWLGNNIKTVIVAAISLAVFGSIITLYTGFKEVDEDKIKLIYTLGGKKTDVVKKIIIPSAIPLILSNMKVNIGLCLVGAIIGEFLSANQGLGYLIIYGSQVFKMDLVMMSIVILCILSALLYFGIAYLEKRLSEKY